MANIALCIGRNTSMWRAVKITRAHQEMRYPNMTWRIIFSVYHWTTTYLYFQNIFLRRPNDNCYISNRRRFTRSVLRILLLSTFRVSSINYSPASGLAIHTRSSANAEGRRADCQLKSCKMLQNVWRIASEKACKLWMTFKAIQSHYCCLHL